MGATPYLGGGFGHFYAYAPTKIEYAINRFAMEVKRQLDVLDRRLGETRVSRRERYTIADIAVWPWYGALVQGKVYDAGEFLAVHEYKNVLRWTEEIAERPRGEARADCQSPLRQAVRAAPRAARRERLRDEDAGQGGSGAVRPGLNAAFGRGA